MALRTGIVVLTLIVEHICRLLNSYRPAINGVIASAVTAGNITSSQATTIGLWLDGAQTACAILKTVSGY
jgi:hypothetical protein